MQATSVQMSVMNSSCCTTAAWALNGLRHACRQLQLHMVIYTYTYEITAANSAYNHPV